MVWQCNHLSISSTMFYICVNFWNLSRSSSRRKILAERKIVQKKTVNQGSEEQKWRRKCLHQACGFIVQHLDFFIISINQSPQKMIWSNDFFWVIQVIARWTMQENLLNSPLLQWCGIKIPNIFNTSWLSKTFCFIQFIK